MALIFEELVNRYAFTVTVDSLGQIRVWKIDGSALIWATRQTFETRQHIDGYPFMKVLLSTCATHVNPENERTKGQPIAAEEVEGLSLEEAEQIAEEVIKRHEYLFEDRNKPIYTERPSSNGREAMVDISEEKLDVRQKEFNEASARSIQGTATSVDRIEKRVESWETKFQEGATKAENRGRINIWIQIAIGLLALLGVILGYKSYQVALTSQRQIQVATPAPPENPQEETK